MQIGRVLVAQVRSGDSYALVFALLLAALFVGIVGPDETWERVLRDVVFAATAVFAYWTATTVSGFLHKRVVVPALALALVVVGAVEGATSQAVAAAGGAVLGAIVAVLVARDLFRRGRVDMQTILGALSLYVIIGLIFASIFAFVGDVSNGPFFASGHDGTSGEYLYFSFVTISTTGYGELSAAGDVGRALAVLEIVLGQLYLVTAVAVIVTSVTRQLPRRDRELGHRGG